MARACAKSLIARDCDFRCATNTGLATGMPIVICGWLKVNYLWRLSPDKNSAAAVYRDGGWRAYA